ncbi:MAG: protein phosphatase CheZ [Gammaproteobacteria bacterium]|nr:MAG: protein phosphatase CheZ [Gammaproteobacteria bacterium]
MSEGEERKAAVPVPPISLEAARELVAALEAGNHQDAELILDQMALARDSELFRELGKLTRQLHDSLRGFQVDSRLLDLTEKDIPDAKERLNYVVNMTEQAANRTLNVVEDCMPVTESFGQRMEELAARWEQFRRKELDKEAFQALCRDLDSFFPEAIEGARKVHEGLSDVLMAQDFQDLTGQIIRRVIELVQEVEGNLVDLIRITGQKFVQQDDGAQEAETGAAPEGKKEEKKERDTAAAGPAVPGVAGDSEVVSSQDEVDDLLSSLGF